MTSGDKQLESGERTKLKQLQAAIERGRRSGIGDRSADEIRAKAKAGLPRKRQTQSAVSGS